MDIDGNDFDFFALRGKVCLIVNVASDSCSSDSNYTKLVELYRNYRHQGLEILAFPTNQCGNESRSEHEIKGHVQTRYGVEFPLFSKIEVNGDDTHPIYRWLKDCLPGNIMRDFGSKFTLNYQRIPMERLETWDWDVVSSRLSIYLTELNSYAYLFTDDDGATGTEADDLFGETIGNASPAAD